MIPQAAGSTGIRFGIYRCFADAQQGGDRFAGHQKIGFGNGQPHLPLGIGHGSWQASAIAVIATGIAATFAAIQEGHYIRIGRETE